ncbi:MAG: hypothetical protein COB02_15955, partial [Candidatus Cloacimonadota bacterium]
ITNSGHTLTAVANGNDIFIVNITDSTNTGAGTGYTFELLKPIDHKPALGLDGSGNLDFIFDITAKNDDDSTIDKDTDTFIVKIVDDSPSAQTISTNEETAVSMNTNADATQGNTTISTQATYGIAVVNVDGTITYTPTNGEDFSGEDTFIYRTAADDGSFVNTLVTVNIAPIVDQPTWLVHAGVSANEDIDTALALVAPVQSDGIDRNDVTINDEPERFGLIEIDGIANGALIKKSGITIFTGNGVAKLFVHISDGDFHPTDLDTTGSVSMTQAEYEALTITSNPHDHTNMTLTLSVKSYEVNDDGTDKGLGASAVANLNVAIDVTAVTDDIRASFITANGGSVIGDEDSWMRVDNLFTFTPTDTDGTETYKLTFDGIDLPAGTIYRINGGIALDASSGFEVLTPAGVVPTIEIKTGTDNSNDISNLSVTLSLKDTDGDSAHTPATITKTIDIDILVSPVANDSTITAGGTSGNEDTKIDMGIVFASTDSETMDSLTITGIPTGAKIYKADGTTLVWTSDGSDFVIDIAGVDPASEDATLTEAEVEGLKILPPQDSNTDIVIGLNAITRNVDDDAVQADDTGTVTASNKKITVIGVVDTALGDTDIADAGRLYTEIDNTATTGAEISFVGTEDVITNLNLNFQNYENKTNATTDNSEVATFIIRNQTGDTNIFTITDAGGTEIGTESDAGWELTEAQLAGAHIKTKENFAGTINLELETTVEESGDDSTLDKNIQVDTFEIVVSPSVDEPSIQVRDLFVAEDSSVKIDVRAVSGDIDGSETTISVLIADIPAGSVLKLDTNGDDVPDTTLFVNDSAGNDSYLLTVAGSTDTLKTSADAGGDITLADLDNLYITSPPHLDGDFILQVTPTIGEAGATNTADAPIAVTIHIQAVADAAVINLSDKVDVNAGVKVNGTGLADGTSQAFSDGETIVVFGQERTTGAGARIPLSIAGVTGETTSLTVSSNPVHSAAKDAGDTSENLSYVLDALPISIGLTNVAGISVGTLISVSSGKGKWGLTSTEIDAGVYFEPAEDFSGIVSGLSLEIIVTENTGDSTSRIVNFSLEIDSVVETTDPIKDSQGTVDGVYVGGIEDATVGIAGAKGDLIDLRFETEDSSGSETITRVEILTSTFKASGTAEHLELYVKDGASWVLASSVGGLIQGTGASEYYNLTAYKDNVAVGVKAGGGLVHINKAVDSLYVSGVTVDVTDSDSQTPDVLQTFTGNIAVELLGRADAAVIAAFTPTSTAGEASGDLMDFNLDGNVTWPDSDGSETHFYIIKVPNSSFVFNQGKNQGDNTWYMTDADLVGLKIQGPNGFNNATIEVTAYSDENTVETTTASVTITDSSPGTTITFPGPGIDTSEPIGVPVLEVVAKSTGEDVSFALNDVVNIVNTHSNDLGGAADEVSFIIKDIPEGFTLSGTFIKFTDASGDTAYRISVAAGVEADEITAALSAVTITPKVDFSGDFTFSLYMVVADTASNAGDSEVVGSTNNVTINVDPVADLASLDKSAMTTSFDEDVKTQVKFDLNSSDGSTDANDLTEVISDVNISIAEGSFVDSSDVVLSTTTLAVTIVGGVIKFGGNDVYYLPPTHKHGDFTISIDYDVSDVTTGKTTDTKLNQTESITVNVKAIPDVDVSNLTVQNETTNEDTAVKLNLTSTFPDSDGSEAQHLTISGMPDGATLQTLAGALVGTNSGGGVWLLSSGELADLYFVPALNQSGDITLSFAQNALEKSDTTYTTDSASKDFTITINAVADGLIMTPYHISGNEDDFIKIFLEPLLTEQGEYNTSPLRDGGGDVIVSDEVYKIEFSNYKNSMQFFYKNGSDYIELVDEDSLASKFVTSKLTQTQLDNLYVIDPNTKLGLHELSIKLYSQEVDGSNNVISTSGGTSTTIGVTMNEVTGADTINGDGTNNFLFGHSGDDIINGLGGADHIYGGRNKDTIDGGAGDDIIYGGKGGDTIDGGAGNDTIFGGTAKDTIDGGTGNDTIDGGSFDDTIHGDAGDDTITGGSGNDTIFGDGGDDTITFDADDTIDGATVDGGADIDTFILESTINIDFDAITVASISNMEQFDLTQNGDHTINNLGINDVLQITDGNNELKIFADAGDVVNLKNGDGGDWVANGTVTENSVTFNIFDQLGDFNVLTVKLEDTITASIV